MFCFITDGNKTSECVFVAAQVQAASEGHDFNWETMDVSHTINHLSFGPFLSEQVLYIYIYIYIYILHTINHLSFGPFLSEQVLCVCVYY